MLYPLSYERSVKVDRRVYPAGLGRVTASRRPRARRRSRLGPAASAIAPSRRRGATDRQDRRGSAARSRRRGIGRARGRSPARRRSRAAAAPRAGARVSTPFGRRRQVERVGQPDDGGDDRVVGAVERRGPTRTTGRSSARPPGSAAGRSAARSPVPKSSMARRTPSSLRLLERRRRRVDVVEQRALGDLEADRRRVDAGRRRSRPRSRRRGRPGRARAPRG